MHSDSLLIPPSFPLGLLHVTPIFDSPSSREQVIETDSWTTAIVFVSLPPKTKVDFCSVFQRFGQVRRAFVHSRGRRANVIFADVHGIKRTLPAYAEHPQRLYDRLLPATPFMRGQEIIVFRKHTKRGAVGNNKMSGVDMDTGSRASGYTTSFYTRAGQLPLSETTQEELSKTLAPFGKYERLVMRMFLWIPHSLEQLGFLLSQISGADWAAS